MQKRCLCTNRGDHTPHYLPPGECLICDIKSLSRQAHKKKKRERKGGEKGTSSWREIPAVWVMQGREEGAGVVERLPGRCQGAIPAPPVSPRAERRGWCGAGRGCGRCRGRAEQRAGPGGRLEGGPDSSQPSTQKWFDIITMTTAAYKHTNNRDEIDKRLACHEKYNKFLI